MRSARDVSHAIRDDHARVKVEKQRHVKIYSGHVLMESFKFSLCAVLPRKAAVYSAEMHCVKPPISSPSAAALTPLTTLCERWARED